MKDDAKEHYARERLAKWLLDHGYSTGHGDTFEDLLVEFTVTNYTTGWRLPLALIDQIEDKLKNDRFSRIVGEK